MQPIAHHLERYRDYLRLLAEAQTGQAVKARVDLSGVVQQSLWECTRTLESGGPSDSVALTKLLRQILSNNLRDEIRRATAQRRDVRLERSIESSSVRLAGVLAAESPSPSENAMQSERALLVTDAIMKLNEAYREVVIRHYIAGNSIDEVASTMNRTTASVAGLLHRALRELRQILSHLNERQQHGK